MSRTRNLIKIAFTFLILFFIFGYFRPVSAVLQKSLCYPDPNQSCANCIGGNVHACNKPIKCDYVNVFTTCSHYGLKAPCCLASFYKDPDVVIMGCPYDSPTYDSLDVKCYSYSEKVDTSAVMTDKNPLITFTTQIPLPGFKEGQQVTGNTFGLYLSAFYVYFVGVAGILAVIMIIYAGIKWITAAGNQSRLEEAKATWNGAAIGLFLVLCAFLILNTINPALVKWKLLAVPKPVPILQEYVKEEGEIIAPRAGELADTICPSGLTVKDINSTSAPKIEIGSECDDPRAVQPLIDKLNEAAKKGEAGVSYEKTDGTQGTVKLKIRLNGCYRSWEYQDFLHKCWCATLPKTDRHCQKGATCAGLCLGTSCSAECRKEFTCSEAAAANCDRSSHMLGKAVDACYIINKGLQFDDDSSCSKMHDNNQERTNGRLTHNLGDKPGAIQKAFAQMMKDAGFYRYCGEWWHFESEPLSKICEPGFY